MTAIRIPSILAGKARRVMRLLTGGAVCLATALPPATLGQTADPRLLATGALSLDQIEANPVSVPLLVGKFQLLFVDRTVLPGLLAGIATENFVIDSFGLE